MTEFNFKGKIKAIEILSKKEFIILSKQNELITENSSCTIAEQFNAPILRRLNDGQILIVESRCDEFEKIKA